MAHGRSSLRLGNEIEPHNYDGDNRMVALRFAASLGLKATIVTPEPAKSIEFLEISIHPALLICY